LGREKLPGMFRLSLAYQINDELAPTSTYTCMSGGSMMKKSMSWLYWALDAGNAIICRQSF
jgi:hypothetical protein